MIAVEILTCLSLIAVAVFLYLIVMQLRLMNQSLEVLAESSRRSPSFVPLSCTHHDGTLVCRWPSTYHSSPIAQRNFAVWGWTGSEWELDQGSLTSNVSPGSPPQFSGSYPGQSVKVECR
jgi:hypothetical protein